VEDYGKKIAYLMFYEGNSYIKPHDDTPRIVDVYSNGGRHLEVGIAKPQLMYVLYPWKGKEVLCQGAVLPYREFVHGERLTDDTWRGLLATPQKPAPPNWACILTEGPAK